MESVPVETIAWTPAGYRAAGGDGLRLAVWASGDGAEWDLLATLSRACCDRYEQGAELMRWGNRLVLLTRGELREGGSILPASFLRVSTDGGATWEEVGGGPFAMRGTSVDTVLVDGDALLVTSRVEDAESRVTNTLWRSTDASAWEQLELPGAPTAGFRSIAATPSGVLVARTFADDGTQAWYRSADNGASFEPVDGPGVAASSLFATVGDRLVVVAEPGFDDAYPPDDVQSGPVLLSTTDGERWEPIGRNTGFWGDGMVNPAPAVGTGESRWFVLARTLREDDAYCFDDVATCEDRQAVLGHFDDDLEFQAVAVDLEPAQHFLVVGDDGSMLLWRERQGPETEDYRIHIDTLRWSGPDPPPLDPVPAPLTPPSDESDVLRFDVSSVEVGETFRIRLALGGCGAGVLESGDKQFYLEDEPSEPYPTTWPFKAESADDAPSGYLFVEGTHPDADTFEFEVDDSTTITYRLNSEPTDNTGCG